jgi:hypothetical protein
MHAMKRLYSAGTALEAHDLRFYLAAHGIDHESARKTAAEK